MSILFYSRGGDGRWRLLNGLYRAMFGGAFVDADDDKGTLKIEAKIDGSDDAARIMVEFTADSFEQVAQAMLDADPDRATKAFGKALALGARRPIYDEDGRELG